MRIAVEVLDPKAKNLQKLIRKTADSAARFFKTDERVKKGFLEIILVGDETLKKNVMSFPSPANFPAPNIRPKIRPLGEIYLNPSYIEKDLGNMINLSALQGQIKKENGLGFMTAFQYLLIHGFLHLLGYLHDKKSDRINMEKKEAEILSELTYVKSYSWPGHRLSQHQGSGRRT